MYRDYHSGVVTAKREKQSQLKVEDFAPGTAGTNQEQSTADDLAGFQSEQSTIANSSRKGIKIYSQAYKLTVFFTSVGKRKRTQTKDEEHYLHYTPSDIHSEQG